MIPPASPAQTAQAVWAAAARTLTSSDTVREPRIISPVSAVGGAGAALSALGYVQGTALWPVANKAYYMPFVLNSSVTITKLWIANGTAATGNVDVGIYNEAGTKQISAESTAQSGASTLQLFDVADTVLAAGYYYFAFAHNTISQAVIHGWADTSVVWAARAVGMYEQTSALPLPSTATFAAISGSWVCPFVGFIDTLTSL